ncbi:type VI secretion system Vgr family protein [Enterovibrio norvegicus]|uniref:type VI secretion system Vgr family protein n=1 Tax=Enterovibrio norvegicus TaxID=188144 RepID=UPI000C84B61E|nr:type VI secretion system tip protein VgrG [Enterovibrio norvegicus]PMH72321.1 type IV secretion protein Rhs [Enterovibrio norvegicus]
MASATGLQFTFQTSNLEPSLFGVLAFSIEEGLSTPFLVNVELISRDAGVSPDSIVDKDGLLCIWIDGILYRQFHGIVSRFTRGDTGHAQTYYTLELVPALQRLSLRQNSRIFQCADITQIIATLLEEMGVDNFAFSLVHAPATREYCVQYRESDLAFVERLAAEEGLFYFFEQSEGKHTLIFADDPSTLSSITTPLIYEPNIGGVAESPYIRSFRPSSKMASSSATLKDYSFKKPGYGFLHTHTGTELAFQRATYEHYDYPGRYKDDGSGKPFTRYRLESLRAESIYAELKSNIPALSPGVKFTVEGPEDVSDISQEWLGIRVNHVGTQPQAAAEFGGEGQTTYNNDAFVIPSSRHWRPKPNVKPRVDGPQIALVVGPASEEIFCDEYGRVKVQFPWDRVGEWNENSSCWVRVAQGWAGASYGAVSVPRIGHEVIVSFLEGDPDQPIITGRTYHAANLVPQALPANKTQTVLRTQTHKGDGFNELRFEDEADQEEIYVHAQKDVNRTIENNESDVVGNDRHRDVKNNETVKIGDTQSVSVGNDQHIKVNRFLTEMVGVASTLTVGGAYQVTVGAAKNESVALVSAEQVGTIKSIVAGKSIHSNTKKYVVQAEKIVLSTKGAMIEMDASGITIKGTKVEIKGSTIDFSSAGGGDKENKPFKEKCNAKGGK